MDWMAWLQTGLLVLTTLLLVSRWISSREHADSDVAKDLKTLKEAHDEKIARVEAGQAEMRKRLHELADGLQVVKVKIAVIETRLDQ